MSEKLLSQIASDLDMIKRLLIFQALNSGHSQSKIASALGTSQASISRMLAKAGDKPGGSSSG
ncbi:MAG TPA: helix-turn-helix domain-containing protein [Caulobacterales bacterium]|nr:helix-turn-helix domain-containing protein [Caulobacterales bacterium]